MSLRERVGRWLIGDPAMASDEERPLNEGFSNSVDSSVIKRGHELFEVFTGVPAIDGLPVVTERSALTISAIWACVSLIAGAISTLPMNIYSRAADGERTLRESDDLWWTLNEEFCPRWVASAGWEWLVMSRLFEGDAYARILRKGPVVSGLAPLHPRRVEPVPWSDGSRLAYIVYPEPELPDQKVEVLDQDDMLHVPGLGFNGTRSLSPLRHALQNVGGVALAAQNYAGQFFANQARPDYALVAPVEAKFDREKIEQMREELNERHALRNGQGGRPMLLTGGLEVKTITLPNKDAELALTRNLQIEEIARIYNVPPFMIGHNEKTTSWGSGVAEMGTAFVRYVLRRHLNAFQNEINRKFFRTASRLAEFDTFELERADLKTLFETFRSALGRAGETPILTRDEVRRLINYGRTPGGDSFEVQGNAKQAA